MRAGWRALAGLLLVSCGGGAPPAPVPPAAPPASASLTGVLTRTVEGGPVSGAVLRAGAVSGRSAADGSFALDLPPGEHRLTISGPGVVERTTTVRAPATGLRLDVIGETGPWTLDFYREIARNGAGGGDLEPLLPWDSEPTFIIDTRPEPSTGVEIPPETVEFVREAIRVTVALLSGGRFTAERIEATSDPPPDMTPGTVILRWNAAEVAEYADTANAFAYRVGGPENVVVFRHLEETWAVHHEIGHVMGLYHPLGGLRPSHMWYSGELEPPHFTEWDIFHAQVMYSRPAGNTDVDVDPPGWTPGGTVGRTATGQNRAAIRGTGRPRRVLPVRPETALKRALSAVAGSGRVGPQPDPRARPAASSRSPGRSGSRRRGG